jgi:hypothetical protein
MSTGYGLLEPIEGPKVTIRPKTKTKRILRQGVEPCSIAIFLLKGSLLRGDYTNRYTSEDYVNSDWLDQRDGSARAWIVWNSHCR